MQAFADDQPSLVLLVRSWHPHDPGGDDCVTRERHSHSAPNVAHVSPSGTSATFACPDAEVHVPELALDHFERDALA
jgi:hypothetical protein